MWFFKQLFAILVLTVFLCSNFLLLSPNALASTQVNKIDITQASIPIKDVSPEVALDRLFTSQKIEEEWFTPQFLEKIPVSQIKVFIDSIKQQLGTYQKVEKKGNSYVVEFSKGSVVAEISLSNEQQIAGLFLKPPSLKVDNWEEIIAGFKQLPGKVSLLVKEDSTTVADLNGNNPLAVGSAFKLAVLKTLKAQIDSQNKSWEDVVKLQAEDKSLPSGVLQSWPDNSPLTLQTLATAMISLSDNTATDILIKQVGREAIEANSPRNRPLLTTRELFVLKGSQNKELLQRYRQGSEQQRRKLLLTEIPKKPLPDVGEFVGNPNALDVEWFYSAEELWELMLAVKDLPFMGINNGIANPNDWEAIAYKGGSEPGVLNFTTWLKAKNGKQYCVVATWNNPNAPVDKSKFYGLYSGVISFLASKD